MDSDPCIEWLDDWLRALRGGVSPRGRGAGAPDDTADHAHLDAGRRLEDAPVSHVETRLTDWGRRRGLIVFRTEEGTRHWCADDGGWSVDFQVFGLGLARCELRAEWAVSSRTRDLIDLLGCAAHLH